MWWWADVKHDSAVPWIPAALPWCVWGERVVAQLQNALHTHARARPGICLHAPSNNPALVRRIHLAKMLDANRRDYDAFLVVHGTDTMAYTSSAMSLMLTGFRKPIVFTGSQLPLAMPRSDARQNLIDSLTCATSSFNPPHVSLQARGWRVGMEEGGG